MAFQYNEGQKHAINTLVDFVNNIPQTPDDFFYTLQGYAGTGKSTIVREIIRKISRKRIVVSAPTHKAKKVIANFTGLKAETIRNSARRIEVSARRTIWNPESGIWNSARTVSSGLRRKRNKSAG